MPLALAAMSHSPLLHTAELPPSAEVIAEIDAAFAHLQKFAADFNPELVVVFAPDHYNGLFYDMMPPFSVGSAAFGVGDYGTAEGPLSVDEEQAVKLVEHTMQQGIDMTLSRRMQVDHGMVQPLETMFHSMTARPMVPIFVNGVAGPFVPMQRIRKMGQAVGDYLKNLPERVLIISSGGLSHDPPVPQWDTANAEVREFLIAGRNPTEEFRNARQQRVISGAAAFARGEANIQPLAPEWDKQFMRDCASGNPEVFDAYDVDEMTKVAGHSSHEVRTWVGAFSALSAGGDFDVDFEYYRAIPEYIAGFGVMTATSKNNG